jgi:transcriptional regulator with XRE-family HTH domain
MGLEAVAHEARIDPGMLSRIETGKQRPSVPVLIRLGKVLDVPELVALERYWRDDD